MGSKKIRNWDRTLTYQPEAVYSPASEDEVVALVRRAIDEGKRIKPMGSALSWSDICEPPQYALRFDRMTRVDVDADRRLARVQPGALLKDVNEVLAQHGVAFDNFGSITMQTAAGYIGTGTHGTGARTPILSAMIESLRLVDGRGEVHRLDRETEPELFSAARVNLGCLGVITEITFRCVEAFRLEERLELVEFDRVLADLDELLESNDYLKLWWLPYTDELQVYAFNRTTAPRSRTTVTAVMDGSGFSGLAFSQILRLSRTFPRMVPRLHGVVQKVAFGPRTRIDRSDKVIKYAGTIPRHQETEYAIPRERAAEAIDRVRKLVLAADYRVNFPLEIRFVAGDDIPMSPASGRDSCYLGGYIASLEWAPRYFAEFEALMGEYQGRPHWGKTFHRSSEELRALYPGYDSFAALRTECDPQGLFRNPFVDRVFPTQREIGPAGRQPPSPGR